MLMLLTVSWRNIWRHPSRSLAVITAIILGLIGGSFISSVSTGLINQSFRETIENQVSHIQLHHPDFPAQPEARHRVEKGEEIAREIRSRSGVKSAAHRAVLDGMAASAGFSAGVRISGVDPRAEEKTTGISGELEEGGFFKETGRLPSAVIGRGLADKLKAGPGSRIVLTFQDIGGELVSASFRVEGIYSVASRAFEERMVYVKRADLNDIIGDPEAVTEIAVLLEEGEDYREAAAALGGDYPDLSIRTWEELAPELHFQQEMVSRSLIWMMGIILLGVGFGVLNTILMSVFERTRELGMLMSIGMKKIKVFTMVLLETSLLSVAGGAAGLIFSFGIVKYFSGRGIDLSRIGGENLHELGFSPEIYPALEPAFYFQVAVLLVVFAVLSAVYPAFRAVRLVPAEAVRAE